MSNHFQTDLTNLKAELDAVNATSGNCPNGVDPADIEIVATSLGEGITKQRQAVKDREDWITPRDKTFSVKRLNRVQLSNKYPSSNIISIVLPIICATSTVPNCQLAE